MKCNICGAELDRGENVCRYCGNDMSAVSDKIISEKQQAENIAVRNELSEAVRKAESVRTGDESVVVRSAGTPHNKFCTRCGRLLDPNTHRCPACDERERELIRIREENMRKASIRAKRAAEERNEKQVRTNVVIAVIMTLVAVFIITAFAFFRLLGSGEGLNGAAATVKPTEAAEETEVPIIDDGNGEVHWKPTNE